MDRVLEVLLFLWRGFRYRYAIGMGGVFAHMPG